MSKTVDIVLGGSTYKVAQLNIDQIERVGDVLLSDQGSLKKSVAMLAIAFERVDPPVEDVRKLEASQQEITPAIEAIMQASGFAKPDPDPNPQAPAAPAGAQG